MVSDIIALVNTQDILNIFLIFGILVITACAIYVSLYLVQALKSLTSLANDLDEVAQNVKNKIGIKILSAIPKVLVSLIGKVIKKRRG